MSPRSDPAPSAELRSLLRGLAAEDLPAVIEQARIDARERVRAILADALSEEMLAGASAPPEPPPAETGVALYVLCIVAAGSELPADVRGIGDSPLTVIEHDELSAVACEVPLAEFGEHALRERLGDMAWLEGTARAHEAALEAIGERVTLVPLRLCTVFRAESGVRELLLRERERLAAALAHLDGRQEWGVKVFAQDAPAEPEGEAADTGADYLRRRQDERDRRGRRAEAVHAACQRIHEALAVLSDEARSNPPQRPEVSGGHMVLNGAYLVADEQLPTFLERARELAGEHASLGLELDLTGPWPAYNFVPDAIGVA